jgi:HEAT repeat protein
MMSRESDLLLPAIVITAMATAACLGQSVTAKPSPSDELADAVRRVQENDLGTGYVDALSYVNVIADAKALYAIPTLEKYYNRTTDADIRAGVASALVSMGDQNDAYWDYLVKLATPALESDAPTPLGVNAGSPKDIISPQLKEWASSHELSVEAATKLAMFDLPMGLAPLAKTGDPRGVPMLRKALLSPNLFIETLGAAGLAEAKDEASVPLIINAYERAPPEMAHMFADSLLFFDDPEAQEIFAFYFPDVNAKEARRFRCSKPFVHNCK